MHTQLARNFARVTGEKNSFLATWKLVFTALEFYREYQPIKWECYPCTRSWHGGLRVSRGEKFIFSNVEIDFYHLGVLPRILTNQMRGLPGKSCFLPLWKLIFTTVET